MEGVFFFRVVVVVVGAEEKAIAGVQQINSTVLHRSQEREGRVDEIDDRGGEAGKVVVKVDIGLGGVEEARKGLGQQFAVGGLDDEVVPKLRDALETVDGPDGETGEDLHDEVVREEAGRRRQSVLRPQLLRSIPPLHGDETAGG
jgi:hypothetical protein